MIGICIACITFLFCSQGRHYKSIFLSFAAFREADLHDLQRLCSSQSRKAENRSRSINGLCSMQFQACMGLIDPAPCVFRKWRLNRICTWRKYQRNLENVVTASLQLQPLQEKPLPGGIVFSHPAVIGYTQDFLVQQVTGKLQFTPNVIWG